MSDHPYDLAWARRVVASIPRPTPAEEAAAVLDYAETALSEAWAALLQVRDWDGAAAERHGGIGVREYAARFLEAHGFAPAGPRPDDPDGHHHTGSDG